MYVFKYTHIKNEYIIKKYIYIKMTLFPINQKLQNNNRPISLNFFLQLINIFQKIRK